MNWWKFEKQAVLFGKRTKDKKGDEYPDLPGKEA